MEYCAVRGPFNPLLDTHTQRFDVHKDVARGLMIAALHDAYVGKDREGSGPAHKLLDLRAKFLVTYALDALGAEPTAQDIKPALEAAFQRVDGQVKSEAERLSFDWPAVFLATKLNSLVVIVHDGWVYTAGSTEAHVFLARDSKPFYLTSSRHGSVRAKAMRNQELPDSGSEPALFYFHQERLQSGDEYLVIGSRQLWRYFQYRDDVLPVLQSRIDAEGLEEACKSMVGRFKDKSKILIVITLQDHAHKAKSRNKLGRLEGVSDVAMRDLLNTECRDIDDPEDRVIHDPLRFLLPYVNGKQQFPEPQTSSEYYAFHNIQKPCEEHEIQISSSLRSVPSLWS